MTDQLVTTRIQYQIDDSSVQQVIDSSEQIENNLSGLVESINEIGDAGTQSSSRLSSALRAIKDDAVDATTEISTLRDSLSGVVEQADELSSSSSGGSGLSGLSSALRAGSQLAGGSRNPLGGGLRIASEITRLESSLGKIEESLPKFVDDLSKVDNIFGSTAEDGGKLAVALGAEEGGLGAAIVSVGAVVVPAVAALAAVGAGFVYFESVLQPAKSALDEAVKSVDDYYKAIVKGTSDSIQSQIDNAQADLAIQQQKLTTLQAPYQINGPLDPLKNALTNIVDPAALKDIQATQQAIKDDSAAIDGLNRALGSNMVAANDAAAAQDAKAKLDIADLNKQAQIQTQRDQLATQGVAAIQKVIDADNNKVTSNVAELEQIYKLRDGVDATTKAYQTYTDEANKLLAENTDLANQATDLTENLLPTVKATEDFKNSVKDVGKVLSDTAKQADNVTKAFGAIEDAAVKYTDTVTATNAARKLADDRAQQDFDNRRLDEIAAFNTKQANQASTFWDNQADQLGKLIDSTNAVLSNEQATALKDSQAYAVQQRNNADQLARDIAKINEQANASELDAAYRLDAHGVENAKRQAAQQITDRTTTYNAQKAISDAAETQKLKDMADAAQKQHDQQLANGLATLAEQRDTFAKSQAQAQQAEDTKLREEKEAFDLANTRRDENDRIQDAARDKNYKDQQAKLNQHLTDMLNTQTAGQKAISDSFSTWWRNLVANAQANAPAPTVSTGAGGGGMPGTYFSGSTSGQGNLPGGISTVLGSSYISNGATQSIGQQFTNGLQSAANTFFSFLGSFDVGTGLQGISRDGIAKLHKGEIVLDPGTSDSLRKGIGLRGMDGAGAGSSSPSNPSGITMGTVNITQNFSVTGSDMSVDKMKPIVKQAMTSVLQDLAR